MKVEREMTLMVEMLRVAVNRGVDNEESILIVRTGTGIKRKSFKAFLIKASRALKTSRFLLAYSSADVWF